MPLYLISSTYGLLTTHYHPSPPLLPPPPPPQPPCFASPYHAYNLSYRDFLDESVSHLGIRTPAAEEVQEAPLGNLEDQIGQWTRAATIAVHVLFPASAVSTTASSSGSVLSPTSPSPSPVVPPPSNSDAVVVGSHTPERLFRVINMSLLNCTSRLLLSPLNCSSFSPRHAYINSTDDAASCASVLICCTFIANGSSTSYRVRVSGVGCSSYRSSVNLNTATTPVSQWGQRAGVELQWSSPREPLCRTQADCEDGSNATCVADTASCGEDPRGRGADKAAGRPPEGALPRRAVQRLRRGTFLLCYRCSGGRKLVAAVEGVEKGGGEEKWKSTVKFTQI